VFSIYYIILLCHLRFKFSMLIGEKKYNSTWLMRGLILCIPHPLTSWYEVNIYFYYTAAVYKELGLIRPFGFDETPRRENHSRVCAAVKFYFIPKCIYRNNNHYGILAAKSATFTVQRRADVQCRDCQQ